MRAYIVHPLMPFSKKAAVEQIRETDDIVAEAEGLARAIDLEIVKTRVAKVARINPGTLLGKGTVEDIGKDLQELKPDVVIINHTLSPVQQQNLEKAWKAKVIDRTGLILEIFGARAQTKEGTIQVRLAALEYQRSRVVRSWTHLERQRGGMSKTGGPGEKQMELDKRHISDKIASLKKQLEEVRRTRELGRKSRERVPYPVVALVGYTNAGKSTLFNRITKAKVFAEDLLFATLDPTMRRIKLKNGQDIILSDTVGFISDLPTHLVASFRATLEQVTQADVIIHVIDASRHDHQAQRKDVIKILADLGIKYEEDKRIIEAWNKTDRLDAHDLSELQRQANFDERIAPISAQSGKGQEDLLGKVAKILSHERRMIRIKIPHRDGKAMAWLHEHAEIIERNEGEDAVTLKISIEPRDLGKFEEQFKYKPKKA